MKPSRLAGHGATITAVFACVAAPLTEVPVPSSRPDWGILESRDTMDLLVQDTRVGRLLHVTSLDSVAGRVVVSTRVAVSGGSSAQGASAMDLAECYTYDLDGKLVSAVQDLKSPSGSASWSLERSSQALWSLAVTAGGVTQRRAIPVVKGSLRATLAIQQAILDGTAKTGDYWTDTVFSLMSGTNMVVVTRCVEVPGDSPAANWVFVNRDDLVGREERWEVDRSGRTVLQEVPPVFTARPARAGGSRQSGELGPVSELFLVRAGPPSPSSVTFVRFKEGFALPDALQGYYTATDSGFLLDRVPERCEDRLPTGAIKGDYIRATVTMQADDERIRKLASRLKGRESRPCAIIRTLTQYVDTAIENLNVATFSSALETLVAGYGDCGEHAVLLGALLRAAGIPARTVLGLVYVPGRSGYLYHAWVMAQVGKTWLFADPVAGRFPAGEGLVPLLVDDTGENAVMLAKAIGRVEISYRTRQR